MIFNLIKHAKQLLFNDSVAKTGSNNVQGAIEVVKSAVDNVKTDLDAVEEETVYCGEGDSFMSVDGSGQIVKITIPENESREIKISVKTVLQEHDNVLNALNNSLCAPQSMENIDISAYTADSGKKYLCPCDGLAWMSCSGVNTTGTLQIYAKNGINFTFIQCVAGNVIAIPVKKGMYINGINFASMRFIKYVY